MRATIDRTGAVNPFDTFGPGGVITTRVATNLPCYVQSNVSVKLAATGRFFNATTYVGLFPLSADLQDEDVLVQVTDRRGNVIWEGLRVESLLPSKESHQEAVLARYS